jgi:hypothetical protein
MEQNRMARRDRSSAWENSMTQKLVPLLIVAACIAPAVTAAERTLTHEQSAEGIDIVAFDAGTGDFELIATDGETIEIEVTLTPRRGGLFSSMKDSEREVERAVLRSGTVRERLMLEIETGSGDRRFEERWQVRLPSRCGVEIEAGVGNVTLLGVAGGVKLEVGVGNVKLEAPQGDLFVDVGVGDAAVKAVAASYGPVEASGGVGDAHIKVANERVESGGFVGHSASWVGKGRYRIQVEVGVGDADVMLE